MNDERIRQLRSDPKLLDSLTPREFEELVAHLLSQFGWKVELTPQTRDGGVDIFATSQDTADLDVSWIVECKKFSENRKVGVELLRQLHGAKEFLGVSNAVLVTTSSFTPDAVQFAAKLYDLKLIDRKKLLSWLERVESTVPARPLTPPTPLYSCFISYSHKDEEFANFFAQQLRGKGIRVWYAPEDIKPGEKIHEEIFQAISVIDKLVVVLSQHSINSAWVKSEIKWALRRERDEGRRILFPISLISVNELKKWELFDSDTGEDLAAKVREYYIPVITDWKDAAKFKPFFEKILQGLKSDQTTTKSATESKSGSAVAKTRTFEGVELSEDSLDIIRILAKERKELVMHRANGIHLLLSDNKGLAGFDQLFIEGDLDQLVSLDLLRKRQTDRFTFIFTLTRRGAEFARSLL